MKAQLQVMSDVGSIVNASSIAGITGRSKNAAYSAAKHGVVGLTRSAAKEFGGRQIRVNCKSLVPTSITKRGLTGSGICPGVIDTPMVAASARIAAENKVEGTVNPCALERVGRPEEIAKPIAFLLSDESS